MSYDDTEHSADVPCTGGHHNPHHRDLEAIVTLLELAALELTPTAGTSFTRDELFARAMEIGGEDFPMLGVDLPIVFRGVNFLRHECGGRWSLK